MDPKNEDDRESEENLKNEEGPKIIRLSSASSIGVVAYRDTKNFVLEDKLKNEDNRRNEDGCRLVRLFVT